MVTYCRIGKIIYMFYQFLFINQLFIYNEINTLTFFLLKKFNGYIYILI